MISSGLCLFCFIVSCFDDSKLLTRVGPVFQAAANLLDVIVIAKNHFRIEQMDAVFSGD
jgi:hypothetical protein